MLNHEIRIRESAKVQKSIVSMYSEELANIQAEDTRETLANILYNRDMSEVNSIRIAYHLSRIKEEQAQAEGYRTSSMMISDITGLKKSMVSNYVKIARTYFTDENGDFIMPAILKGFTITQLTEGTEKAGSIRFLDDIAIGNITPDMSAKKIREYYKDQEAIDTTATEVTENTTETSKTDSTHEPPHDVVKKESIFVIDENGNKIAEIVPINGYGVDGVLGILESGKTWWERG